MQNINFEKITAYVVILGTIYMFWQSQMDMKNEICETKVKAMASEKDIEYLGEKLNKFMEQK